MVTKRSRTGRARVDVARSQAPRSPYLSASSHTRTSCEDKKGRDEILRPGGVERVPNGGTLYVALPQNLPLAVLELIVKSDHLVLASENDVFALVTAWAIYSYVTTEGNLASAHLHVPLEVDLTSILPAA
jgi:hypothetical protein